MPWKDVDMMTLRQEFTALAQQEGVNFSALCARFGISRKTGYKWLERVITHGPAGLQDCSRRPCSTPLRTNQASEELVVAMRLKHPTWGGRKIHRSLLNHGHIQVPTPSTITRILHRHGLIAQTASANSTPWQRFEHAQPNDLWQIDFKGHFQTGQATCHPLTVLDDHSRYNIVLHACLNPDTTTVQAALETAFRRYGMPVRINADNGSPWGSPSQYQHGITKLTIWLIQLGIRISHSRPAHPQTNGKEERFHRTLKADVLHGRHFFNLQEVQDEFDRWRMIYNNERPHEAIGMATPVTRFRQSRLAYPEQLPEIVYPDEDLVETVGWNGHVKFHKRSFRVSNALHRYRIAARAVPGLDGIYDLYFAHQRFGQIDLRDAKKHD
ncbi:MAG: IS481 family transposase [Sphingobacteriales bacterium]|nr:MAG: IS481 family transposase [Sphingobacteriales bacterium]